MEVLNQADALLGEWLDRYERGREFIRHVVPGVALLWQEYTDRGEVDSFEYAQLSAELGCLLRAYSDNPFDWGNLSSLHEGYCYTLIGQAMLALEPPPTFHESVAKVEAAYALIGQRAAGKGTALRVIEEMGVQTAPSSQVLRDAVAAQLKMREATVPELIQGGKDFKTQFGSDVLIRWTAQRMFRLPEHRWRRLAIDGLRTLEELEAFREVFGDRAKIVGIIAPPDEVLWTRIQKRQQETGRVDYATFADFKITQEVERERIAALLTLADVRIDNIGSEDEFLLRVRDLVSA